MAGRVVGDKPWEGSQDSDMSAAEYTKLIQGMSKVPARTNVAPVEAKKPANMKELIRDPDFLTGVIKGMSDMTSSVGNLIHGAAQEVVMPKETTLPYGVTSKMAQEYHNRKLAEANMINEANARQRALGIREQEIQAENQRTAAQAKLAGKEMELREKGLTLEEQQAQQQQSQFETSEVGKYILQRQSEGKALDLEGIRAKHAEDIERIRQQYDTAQNELNRNTQLKAAEISAGDKSDKVTKQERLEAQTHDDDIRGIDSRVKEIREDYQIAIKSLTDRNAKPEEFSQAAAIRDKQIADLHSKNPKNSDYIKTRTGVDMGTADNPKESVAIPPDMALKVLSFIFDGFNGSK